MRSQYIVFDIVMIGVSILVGTLVVNFYVPKFPNRYIINEEYYTMETLLMHRVNNEYVFEMVRYGDLNPTIIKADLDDIIPKGYYYLFEIPEYKFRVSNNDKLNSFNNCVKLEKIYPVVRKFDNVHLVFAIWDKNEKMEVIKCER